MTIGPVFQFGADYLGHCLGLSLLAGFLATFSGSWLLLGSLGADTSFGAFRSSLHHWSLSLPALAHCLTSLLGNLRSL